MDPAQLVRMYAADVFALCRAMVRQTQTAEDLAQDTFARAFAALDGYRGEASPRTWLLAIARNRCLDHLARAKRAPWGRDPDPEPDDHATEQPAPSDLLADRTSANRAMAALAEGERALIVLHYGHGLGYPELADAFGLAQGAVRMRVSRALAKMREALAGDERGLALGGGRGRRSRGLDEPMLERARSRDTELEAGGAFDGLADLAGAGPATTFASLVVPPPARLLARLDALAAAVQSPPR